MYYERHGRPDAGAPPVLLLHGLGSSATDWTEQLAAFAEHYRLLLPDLPGHYRSALPAGRLTVERMAAELGRLLDALGEPPVHLVGISLGACVGVALAIERPARVRSLLLINGFARFRPANPASAIRALARVVLLAMGPTAAGAALVAGSMFPRPEQAELRRAAGRSLARTSRRTYLAAMAALATFDARARLARVRCPALVVAGEGVFNRIALEFLAAH